MKKPATKLNLQEKVASWQFVVNDLINELCREAVSEEEWHALCRVFTGAGENLHAELERAKRLDFVHARKAVLEARERSK